MRVELTQLIGGRNDIAVFSKHAHDALEFFIFGFPKEIIFIYFK